MEINGVELNGEAYERTDKSASLRRFLGQAVLGNRVSGVRIHSALKKSAVLSDIDIEGDRRAVRVYHGQWTDLGGDGTILWSGRAQVAVPLDDEAEPRIVVISDDFSRLNMDYEFVVDGVAAA